MHRSSVLRFWSTLSPRALAFLAFATSVAAAPSFPVEEISIADLTAAYSSGKTTVRAVVQAHLDRIAAYDPLLGSIVVVNPQALAEADKLDTAFKSTGNPVGPLHGVPVLIKDNYDVAGLQTTGGSAALIGWIPARDSTAVARLRTAGAIVLAKTTMSEWARGGLDNINSVLPGFARNPYNLPYATGGSSGGTGSGVAASFGVAGLGSDTFGSIRNPSSNNALVGLRPSWALVPRTGMVGLYDARDTAGPMARSVTDLVRLLDLIAGPDAADPATAAATGKIPATYATALTKDGLRGKRLGVLRQAFPKEKSDPQVLSLIDRAIADLRAQGAEIIDPFTVPEFDQFPSQSHPQSEVRAAIEKYLATTGPAFPKTVADVVASKKVHPLHESGLILSSQAPAPSADPIVAALLKSEDAMRAAYLRAMDAAKVDALILPVASFPPKLNGDRNTTPTGVTTWIASMLHWPALSVPMGTTHDNLPSGLQFVGRPWSELTLLSLGYAYEQATHHRLPPPTTPPLATSLAAKFIGTWKLVAVRERDPATGTEKPSARDALDGQLLYAANGRLSVQIIRQGRDKAAPGTTDGFSSYFGTWKLLPAEGCVVHQQDRNLNQAQAGQAAKRTYSFDAEGLLSLATPPRRATPDAPEFSTVFLWRRLP
jgi:Asp-tRNA(Asn)/Glu-tRNA(Gln) amidotransferase A subunit family amidase